MAALRALFPLAVCLLALVVAGCVGADTVADTMIRAGVAMRDPATGELVKVATGDGGTAGTVGLIGGLLAMAGTAYFAITGRKRPGQAA